MSLRAWVLLLFFGHSALLQAATALLSRPLWTNTALLGSPDPPPPYTVERTFPRIQWKAPMYLIPEPGTEQLLVVQQGGEPERPSRVLRFENQPDATHTEAVLQLDRRLIYALTFHPGYRTNRLVFVFSNGPTGAGERTNRVARYRVSSEAPFACEPASERVVLEWRSAGHDGGDLAFGRDGMLYVTSGDGTSDSDGWDSGQDVTRLLAKLLRLDVDHPPPGKMYGVPADNPFLNLPEARPETWAYGFRNPWRMGIDERTGDIWVGNNGQDLWETAYLVRRGDNFGWSVSEGSHPFHARRRRGPTPIVAPTIEHSHAEFRSLTGGIVYYGDKLPELNGAYVYGDYATGRIWGALHRAGRLVWHRELAVTSLQIAAFRAEPHGELLVVDHGGGIYRLRPNPDPATPRKFPTRLSETGLFDSVPDGRAAPGLIPYAVNAPGWVDGAQADRYIALPGTDRIQYASSRGWNLSNDAALVQTLWMTNRSASASPAGRRRLETRVLLKQHGEWAGYSYVWNTAQTDAVLAPREGEDLALPADDGRGSGARPWRVPSRAECLACHARAVNFVLGLCEVQMNRDFDYGHGPENQLARLQAWQVLQGPPKDPPASLPHLVNPYDARQDLAARARSFLHANCSVCHVEAGGGNSRMELEFSRTEAQMNVFDSRPQHDTFGLANAMVIAPGHPEQSVLLARVSRRGLGQMPPLMTLRVDDQAVELLGAWIRSLKPAQAFVRAWTTDELAPALSRLQPGRPLHAGKELFTRLGCVQCHRRHGEGGAVGPDLTGVGRRLDSRALLESVLDPSKVIADEFATYDIELRSGETFNGQIEREDDRYLVLRTGSAIGESVRVPKADIQRRSKSAVSNMPAGMLNVLDQEQILDLLAYLRSDAPE